MALRLYNTLSGRKEEFTPLAPPRVGMYVCGVTVYAASHIGHARANIVFDVIYRYLQFSGFDVTYVRNYTDVDLASRPEAMAMAMVIAAMSALMVLAYMNLSRRYVRSE